MHAISSIGTRTIVEVPKVSFPWYLTLHSFKLGTEFWIGFQFAYLLDKMSLIFLKINFKKNNPSVCFILKVFLGNFLRNLFAKILVILDTQMSLHKNYFDRWQTRFLCFIFIFNVESEKVNMSDLCVHFPPYFYPLASSWMFTVATLWGIMSVLAGSVNKKEWIWSMK